MVAFGTFLSGLRTLAAATAAVSTPRELNRQSAIAPPMAERLLPPLTFQGGKLPELMKNNPTVDMNTSGMNFRIDVQVWTAPMFLTPLRLIGAGIHSPSRAIRIENHLFWPLLTNSST